MAIAITLLVLDLKVPDAVQVHDGNLLGALAARWPSYLAYLAAFLTIGIIWLNHRAFVDRIRRFDGPLHWFNLLLLLGVATLPFPTSLLAAYLADGGSAASTAAVIYGLLSVATALPWLLMWRHLVRHPELLEPPPSTSPTPVASFVVLRLGRRSTRSPSQSPSWLRSSA